LSALNDALFEGDWLTMKSRIAPALLAGIAGLALAAPAQAAPKEFFFTCQGDPNKAQTFFAGDPFTWTAEKPATSYQAGGGCGYADTWVSGTATGNTIYDAIYGGSYAGAVRRFEFTLHHLAPHPVIATKEIDVRLEVDGEMTFEGQLSATAVPSSTGASASDTFIINDIDLPETTAPKQFLLSVSSHYTDDPSVWVHGASEFPSGVRLFTLQDLVDIGEEPVSDEPAPDPVLAAGKAAKAKRTAAAKKRAHAKR
jgi:hypothetical protein